MAESKTSMAGPAPLKSFPKAFKAQGEKINEICEFLRGFEAGAGIKITKSRTRTIISINSGKTSGGGGDVDLGALELRVGNLESDVGGLMTDVSDLQSDVGGLMTDVFDLQSDVGGLMTDVSDLQSDVGGLMTDVSDLQSDVGGLMTDVSDIQTTIAGYGTATIDLCSGSLSVLTP